VIVLLTFSLLCFDSIFVSISTIASTNQIIIKSFYSWIWYYNNIWVHNTFGDANIVEKWL
jgi:hypothetical protein